MAPASDSRLPSGYTLTDTSYWSSLLEEGQRAVLRRGGSMIDTVDLTFGVVAVGQDSLVFLPVHTDTTPLRTTPEPVFETFPTEHVFWTPVSRRELRDFLPFFNSNFSSPVITRDSSVLYWGLARHERASRLYGMRYDFRTAHLDSLYLNREDSTGTDYRYHFGRPQVHGNEVSFDGVVLDATTWRIVRQPPLPTQ